MKIKKRNRTDEAGRRLEVARGLGRAREHASSDAVYSNSTALTKMNSKKQTKFGHKQTSNKQNVITQKNLKYRQ